MTQQVSEVVVRWTPETSGRARGIEIQARIAGTDQWDQKAKDFDPTLGEYRFTSNAPSTQLEVRARIWNTDNIPGDWFSVNILSAPAAGDGGTAGRDAYAFLSSNEVHQLPAQSDGTIIAYTGASTTLKVLCGAVDVTSSFTSSTAPGGNPQNLAVTGSYPTFFVSSGFDASEDVATFTFRMTGSGAHAGVVGDVTLSLSKSKAAVAGVSPPLIDLSASSNIAPYDGNGVFKGTAITFSARRSNTTLPTIWGVLNLDGTSAGWGPAFAQAFVDSSNGGAAGYFSSPDNDTLVMNANAVNAFMTGRQGFVMVASLQGQDTVLDRVTIMKVADGLSVETYSISAYGGSAILPVGFAPGLRKPNGDYASSAGVSRGFNVSYRTGVGTWLTKNFDVFGNGAVEWQPGGPSQNNGAAMVTWINSIPAGAVVAVVSHDEPQGNLFSTPGLVAALYGLGASTRVLNAANVQYRSAYTLVGVKGWTEGKGFEQYAGAISSDPRAYVQSTFSVVNGVPQSAVPGPAAATAVTLIPRTAATGVTADTVYTDGTQGGWTLAHARSKESYTGAVVASWIIPPDGTGVCDTMAGLSSHPDTTAASQGGNPSLSFDTVEYAIHRNSLGAIGIFVDGIDMVSVRGNTPSVKTDRTICRVEYDGIQSVSFYIDNTLYWRQNRQSKAALYFAAALASANPSLTDIKLIPTGKAADPVLPLVVRSPDFGDQPNSRLTYDGKSVKKWSGGDAWNADAYSAVGFKGGAQVSFKSTSPGGGTHHLMVGLNSDPTTDASYYSLDFAWHLRADGYAEAYASGNSAPGIPLVGPGYGAGDFAVRYDGRSKVEFLYQGVVRGSMPTTADRTFYMDSSFHSVGAEITDLSFTAVGTAGESALVGYLTNESVTFPSDTAGNVTSYTGNNGSFKVMLGTQDVTAQCSFSISAASFNGGAFIAPIASDGTYACTTLGPSLDSAWVEYRAVYGSQTIILRFTLSKSKAGASGASPPVLQVVGTPQALRYDKDDNYIGGDVVFRATFQNATGPVGWSSAFGHGIYSTAGVSISGANSEILTISAARMRDVIAYNVSQGAPATETIIAGASGVSDRFTVTKVKDGANGAAGQSALVAGPSQSTVSLTGDANGVPVEGELPRLISNGATVNGVAVSIDSISNVVTQSCAVTIVGSSVRIDSVSAVTASVSYKINASGQSASGSIAISTSKAPPPPASQSSATITVNNQSSFNNTPTQRGTTVTLTTGSSAPTLRASFVFDFRAPYSESGSVFVTLYAQLYYRVAGGTWTPFGSEYSAISENENGASSPGYVEAEELTGPGLSPNTTYEFAVYFRRPGARNALGITGNAYIKFV